MAHDWLYTLPLGVECAGAPAPPPGVWRADGPRCPPSGVVLCRRGLPLHNPFWLLVRDAFHRLAVALPARLTSQRPCSHEDLRCHRRSAGPAGRALAPACLDGDLLGGDSTSLSASSRS